MVVDKGRARGYTRPRFGAWRSLVAHLFWVQGVVSSNLAAPTKQAYRLAMRVDRRGEILFGRGYDPKG